MFKIQLTNRRFALILFCFFALALLSLPSKGQIQLSKPKTEKPLPNPSLLNSQRDDILQATKQMLETREVPIDREDCNQLTGECTLISKPIIFIKGTMTRSQLEHYCEVPAAGVKNWTKGRYVLRIQISPASPKSAQVGVYAKFEGMLDDFSGNQWVSLNSKGEMENLFLKCIQDRVNGGDCKDIFEKER